MLEKESKTDTEPIVLKAIIVLKKRAEMRVSKNTVYTVYKRANYRAKAEISSI